MIISKEKCSPALLDYSLSITRGDEFVIFFKGDLTIVS